MVRYRPVAIDLFSGAGGLTLGFEQAGFDILASVEYDAVHAAVHSFNFPHTQTLCADVRRLSAGQLREAAESGWERHKRRGQWNGEVDVIFGGPPCQGFSSIGKRLIDDQRNQLVFHFFRIIEEIRPRYFVMENVPGMRTGGHAGILDQLIEEFRAAGYRIAHPVAILNAADYGVPQDRRRLFLLGARSDQSKLSAYPTAMYRRPPKRGGHGPTAIDQQLVMLPDGPTVLDAIGDLPDLDRFRELLVTDEVRLSPAQLRRMEARASRYVRHLRQIEEDGDLSRPRVWDRALLTSSLRTEHTQLSISRFADTAPGDTEPISRFLRLDPAGLCNTLRAGTGSERGAYTSPRPIHPLLPRVISVREAARLHSFPDWFRLHRTKWHGFRQVGNAVPPLLARAVASCVVAALGVRPQRPKASIELGDDALLSFNMSDGVDHFGIDPSSVPPPRQREAKVV